MTRDYAKIEERFRALLWQLYPGATTNQVHRTAKKFADLVREENEQYARELAEAERNKRDRAGGVA